MPRRSRDRLRRLALLTPSCGGHAPRADREEKRVTYGNGLRREEWLDPNNPNQRRLLGQKRSNETHASPTDPDARLYRKADTGHIMETIAGPPLSSTFRWCSRRTDRPRL